MVADRDVVAAACPSTGQVQQKQALITGLRTRTRINGGVVHVTAGISDSL